jgi:hypothetical protein
MGVGSISWFKERLQEPSTYRGIAMILSATGVGIAPELIYQIGATLAAVIGAIEVARKEK